VVITRAPPAAVLAVKFAGLGKARFTANVVGASWNLGGVWGLYSQRTKPSERIVNRAGPESTCEELGAFGLPPMDATPCQAAFTEERGPSRGKGGLLRGGV